MPPCALPRHSRRFGQQLVTTSVRMCVERGHELPRDFAARAALLAPDPEPESPPSLPSQQRRVSVRKPRWTTRTGRRQIALVALVVGAVVFSLSVGVGPAAASPGSQAQQKSAAAAATGSQTGAVGHVTVGHSARNDVSAPLRSIAKPAVAQAAAKSQPVLALPTHQQAGPTRADPAVQSQPAAP